MIPVSQSVPAGAAYLDEHDPGWWRDDVPNAIDLDRLNLRRSDLCVLGQRCPLEMILAGRNPYQTQLWRLTSGLAPGAWARRHGFTLLYTEASPDAWADLTLAWHVLISERRKLAAEGGAP